MEKTIAIKDLLDILEYYATAGLGKTLDFDDPEWVRVNYEQFKGMRVMVLDSMARAYGIGEMDDNEDYIRYKLISRYGRDGYIYHLERLRAKEEKK